MIKKKIERAVREKCTRCFESNRDNSKYCVQCKTSLSICSDNAAWNPKKNALLFHRSKLSFPHYLYTTHAHTALLFILSHFIANNFSFCEERKTTNTIIITCDVVAYAVAYTVFSRLVLVICLFHIEE